MALESTKIMMSLAHLRKKSIISVCIVVLYNLSALVNVLDMQASRSSGPCLSFLEDSAYSTVLGGICLIIVWFAWVWQVEGGM
jgi:hypothetical protein